MIKLPNWINLPSPSGYLTYILGVFLVMPIILTAQTDDRKISLEELVKKAVHSNALRQQADLLEQKRDIQLRKWDKSRWPDIEWNTQGTYQSDNIKFSFPVPQLEPIELPLYKFQSTLESRYALYDGGMVSALKEQTVQQSSVDRAALDVSLFSLQDKVVELYFGIMKLSRQVELIDSSYAVFDAQSAKVEAAVKNGVALPSDRRRIDIEKADLDSKKVVLLSKRKAALAALSALIHEPVSPEQIKQTHDIPSINPDDFHRPETQLFQAQKQLIEQGGDLIRAKRKPKVSLFAKAGVGYPNPVNFFDTDFAPFAIAGAAMHWTIYDWKKSKIERQLLSIQAATLDVKQQTTEDQWLLRSQQIQAELDGLNEQEMLDDRRIALQKEVVHTEQNRYQQGVITLAELISAVNKLTSLRLTKEMHLIDRQYLKFKLLSLHEKLY